MPDKEPKKKKFYEEIEEAVSTAIGALIEEWPELEGAAIALAYSQEIGDPPACVVLGDLNSTSLLCHLGIQTGKLQQTLGAGVTSHFEHASRIAAGIQQGNDEQGTDKDGDEKEEA